MNEKLNKNKNFQMARFISLLIGCQGLLMSILTYADNKITSMIAVCYGILMLFVFIYTTKTKKVTLFYIIGCIMVLLLELYFLYSGGTEGFGIIWISVLPLFSVYLFNFTFFFVINSVYFLILALGMWTPLSQFIYPFSKVFMTRYPLVYLLSFLFGGFLSYRIKKTEEELDKQRNLLKKEINQASTIQKTFFNQNVTETDNWSFGYQYLPMSGVTGDLIDFFQDDNTTKGFGLFDISGHGISSGLLSLLVKIIITKEYELNRDESISKIVEQINLSYIKEKGEIQNYLTGIIGKFNNNTIDLVNAGHPDPIIYRSKTNTFEFVNRPSESVGAIGLREMPTVYKQQSINFEKDDELILFTDGIIDCENEEGYTFGKHNIINVLKNNIDKTPSEQVKSLIKNIIEFRKNADKVDDITVLIIRKK